MADEILTIDGREASIAPGQTLLGAAAGTGIEISTLCNHPSLEPAGACRLCVVEVTWPDGRSALVPSCTTPADPGLEVATDTDRVRASRRATLELLLARAPESRTIRRLARQVGLSRSRFEPLVEPDDCVLCSLCVRVCEKQVGQEAICFAGRSAERHVAGAFGRPSTSCISCGACVAICPTGALSFEDFGPLRRLMLGTRVLSETHLERCTVCGTPFATRAYLEWVHRSLADEPGAGAGFDLDTPVCPSCARPVRARCTTLPMTRY